MSAHVDDQGNTVIVLHGELPEARGSGDRGLVFSVDNNTDEGTGLGFVCSLLDGRGLPAQVLIRAEGGDTAARGVIVRQLARAVTALARCVEEMQGLVSQLRCEEESAGADGEEGFAAA